MYQHRLVHESVLVRLHAWHGWLLDVPAAEKGLCTNLDWCRFWYVQASRLEVLRALSIGLSVFRTYAHILTRDPATPYAV